MNHSKIKPIYSGPTLELYSVSSTTDQELKYFPEGISAG